MDTRSEQANMLDRVKTAVDAIRAGKMVIMVDDEDRENEGDLVIAAECITPELVNFLVKYARGLVCLTLEPSIIDRLQLPMMEDGSKRTPSQGTAFTVSIEARDGVTTGISAADRSHTIQVAIRDDAQASDLVVPGHIFPLKARPGGVLERAGHTEGSVDIAKMAGYKGAGVICEIMNDDGTMARMSDLEVFAQTHDIPIIAIADLIEYRCLNESMIEKVAQREISLDSGRYQSFVYRNTVDATEHLAIVKGDNFNDRVVDVRVHKQKPLSDSLGSREQGVGRKVSYGLQMLSDVDTGVFLYLSSPTHSLAEELAMLDHENPESSSESRDSADEAEMRLHGTGAQILRALGISKMRVHSTSAKSMKGLSGFGLEVVETCLFDS